MNLFAAYNGEITYLDIHESTYRKLYNSGDTNEVTSNQYLRQKDWSHRFHCGFDYFLSPSDQFNFYAFVNPYSREHDGNAETHISGNMDNDWNAKKEDTDIHVSTFYSLYYKHVFGKEGREITLDVRRYHLKAENTTIYVNEASERSPVLQTNSVKPGQHTSTIKIDYATPLWNQLNLSSGAKARFQFLQDRYSPEFNYCENIFGAYGTVSYKHAKIGLSVGLRAEKSVSSMKNSFSNHAFSLLPYSSFSYKYTAGQSILLSYKRSISRPNIYQLNPFIFSFDPYTTQQGNPLLEPELRSSVSLEHSIQFKSHYFSSGLFYNKQTGVIHNLTLLNDTGTFETHVVNLGTVHQYGVQFLASWKLGNTTLNPYFRLFNLSSRGNSLARRYAVENRQNIAFESGLSAMVSFKHDLAFSLVF